MFNRFYAARLVGICCGVFLAAMPVRSAILLSDFFDYPDGPIVGAPGSPWQSHSGTADTALVVSSQLELATSRSEDVNALLAGQPYSPSSSTVLYSGFTVRFTALPSSGGGYFAHFNSSGFRALVWASTSNAPGGQFRLGISNTTGGNASSGQLTNNLSLHTTYTVVTRYDVATGMSAIWLNPQAESDPNVTATDAPNLITVTSYAFRQAAGIGTLFVDNLRVGTQFLEVITESGPPIDVFPYEPRALSVLTYNLKGNGVDDWTTNSLQVRAIGRQMAYLNPDVITFQEIPRPQRHEMTNFIKAFLPGYDLARFSGTDGHVHTAIASRYPILRETRWLQSSSLLPFGYDGQFTRDLFEAEILVPHFPEPLHVFTTHLKALSDSNSAARRAAEASAISNFFVTAFLTTNAHRPYILTGDLNEDVSRPPGTSQQPIQRLANPATGLHLTTPRNPFTNDDRTWSIQGSSLSVRFDYILPSGVLFSNIAGAQVFRTDLLDPTPVEIEKFDNKTASDHLPVLMVFNNPYDPPLQITSTLFTNQMMTVNWRSSSNRQYHVQVSTNLVNWITVAANLKATGTNVGFSTNLAGPRNFFRVNLVP